MNVGSGPRLCEYRWDGEQQLLEVHDVAVTKEVEQTCDQGGGGR